MGPVTDPVAHLSPRSEELVEAGDLDRLTAHVKDMVAADQWEELELLRARCRVALDRGKQLWGVSAYIEYRLCLDAPGNESAKALETAQGRFTLGPLPEVAASSHEWRELAPYLHATPQAAMFAHERVLRGERLDEDARAVALPPVLDLPLHLCSWEPHYRLAGYKPEELSAPAPKLPGLGPRPSGGSHPGTGGASPGAAVVSSGPARDVCLALEDLAATWTTESDGRAEAVCVRGTAIDAVSALGARHVEITGLEPKLALAHMGWAAASGGAHGRRRGGATGRFGTWSVLAAIAGASDDWAHREADLAVAVGSSKWYGWGSGDPVTGWSLRLAIEVGAGPHRGCSFAVAAVDAF